MTVVHLSDYREPYLGAATPEPVPVAWSVERGVFILAEDRPAPIAQPALIHPLRWGRSRFELRLARLRETLANRVRQFVELW